jgi:hypothetical protein
LPRRHRHPAWNCAKKEARRGYRPAGAGTRQQPDERVPASWGGGRGAGRGWRHRLRPGSPQLVTTRPCKQHPQCSKAGMAVLLHLPTPPNLTVNSSPRTPPSPTAWSAPTSPLCALPRRTRHLCHRRCGNRLARPPSHGPNRRGPCCPEGRPGPLPRTGHRRRAYP